MMEETSGRALEEDRLTCNRYHMYKQNQVSLLFSSPFDYSTAQKDQN